MSWLKDDILCIKSQGDKASLETNSRLGSD